MFIHKYMYLSTVVFVHFRNVEREIRKRVSERESQRVHELFLGGSCGQAADLNCFDARPSSLRSSELLPSPSRQILVITSARTARRPSLFLKLCSHGSEFSQCVGEAAGRGFSNRLKVRVVLVSSSLEWLVLFGLVHFSSRRILAKLGRWIQRFRATPVVHATVPLGSERPWAVG